MACGELLVLAQQLFLPGDHAANLLAQLIALLGQQVHGFLRAGLLVVVVLREAFEQRLRLMPGVFDAAADRAGLVVLQLHAQLLDTGAAGQALALQQLPGDAQGLLGDGQFITNADAFAVELFALLLGALLLLCEVGKLPVDVLLTGP